MLQLTEHNRSNPVALTQTQQQKLREWFHAAFEPAEDGLVHVTPGPRVGGAEIEGLRITVAPKIPIPQLLTIIADIADPYGWLEVDAVGMEKHDVDNAIAALFVRACQQTLERGLHRAYRRERKRSNVVRGKLLVPQTIRQLAPIPVTVETDVFDEDTSENQILAAVLRRVRATPSLSARTRQWAHRVLPDIRHVSPLRDPLAMAYSIEWTRHESGEQPIPGFVIDMLRLIEQWVRVTLRQARGLNELEMPDSWKGVLWLDTARRVELQPDLAIRREGNWIFVGDVKYKILQTDALSRVGADGNDIYQMLAYLTVTGLPEGVLIYTGTAVHDETFTVTQSGAKIYVISLNLTVQHAKTTLRRKLHELASFSDHSG